ncbi:peptidoglycan DD-metalloendopeptidase family protein [Saccharothrix sp. 6-C]|uniref:M23 family metallopeptidase n=1 Tax=Saccharothrix sp. 6-C TaxID=2781735 RepID=UPI001916FD1B|nr:M23 family metallopeptidase [Saccharothrix sp. 6-C]QQQ77944.1 peptidoglycan DD-metalloendopeptidase family protein [Saccharothrix sp. 6-C]
MSRRVFVTALVAPLIGLVLTQGEAAAAPTFQMPFPCNQVWEGQTRTNHSPANSVDFNRANDDGDPVVASAAGSVTRVANEGSTSYGRWVEIDHGGGWRTRYAHLSAQSVSVGQSVRIGQRVGSVGTTGGSTGPHLHYEQRLNGVDQKIKFNGTQIYYWGTRSYTSRNSCGTSGVTGTVGTDSGAAVTIRSGPGTQYAAVGSVASGATVTISCQAKGETITGKYGTTSLWDKIGSGYISDAYVYTGSDGQVAPSC